MQKQRIEVIDYLRGFALLGITIVNVFQVGTDYDSYISSLVIHSMESKFIYMFIFLLGLSSMLFMSSLKERSEKANLIYIRRSGTLLLIGISLVFVGIPSGGLFILYAIFGLIGFVFLCIPPMINIVVFIAIAILVYSTRDMVLIEAESSIVSLVGPLSMFSMVILGIFVGQISFYNQLQRFKGLLVTALVILLFLSYHFYSWAFTPINSLVMSLFYIVFFTILSMYIKGRRLSSFLIAYGRMSMSNFIVHTSFIYFYLMNNQSLTSSALTLLNIALFIIIIQIIYSNIWLKYFKMGPAEWIWRMGTYWKKIRIVDSVEKGSKRS
ncbi:DUF418 domain-containing protein [Lysinibacillus xylanilyticus]|uniref:DUF418 domain-containing protein n=1 Tax=Lysinibacillus xylanilyticus TaxID=582475 RepID=UPI0037FD5E05